MEEKNVAFYYPESPYTFPSMAISLPPLITKNIALTDIVILHHPCRTKLSFARALGSTLIHCYACHTGATYVGYLESLYDLIQSMEEIHKKMRSSVSHGCGCMP